jgi:hypothetical protein
MIVFVTVVVFTVWFGRCTVVNGRPWARSMASIHHGKSGKRRQKEVGSARVEGGEGPPRADWPHALGVADV